MGVKINAQEDSGSEYVKALYVIGAGFIRRLTKPWLWLDALYNLSAEGRFYNRNLKIVQDFTLQVGVFVEIFSIKKRTHFVERKILYSTAKYHNQYILMGMCLTAKNESLSSEGH